MYDVVVVGGGPAGLSAALTLASTKGAKGWESLEVLVIDNQKSDFLKAELYNVPFLPKGISGKDALEMLSKQLLDYSNAKITHDEIVEISGKKGAFTLKGTSQNYETKYVIIATGAHGFTIKGTKATPIPHTKMPREGMSALALKGRNLIEEGIYAAGLLAGETTMFACASGSGVESACAIFSDLKEKVTILHDSPGTRS
ncbi:MAG: FAD-dependent oxidoreductase [Wolinella sp.]